MQLNLCNSQWNILVRKQNDRKLSFQPACKCAVTQSCLVFCDPMYYSLPGFSVHGILQARVVEWVAFSPPRGFPDPGIELLFFFCVSCMGMWFFINEPPGDPFFFFFFFNKLYLKMVNMYSKASFNSQMIYYFESNLIYLVSFPVYMIFKNMSKE